MPLLQAKGHDVLVPALTGLGERAHLLSPEVGLSTMVRDVVGVLEAEELTDVVLVGHSFGALPVLGAADLAAGRIRRIVLLDGLVVAPGRRAFDSVDPAVVTQRETDAKRRGHGIAIPQPSAESFGVTDPEDAAWVTRRLTPQPLRSYREPLALANPLGNGLPVTYLHCTEPEYAAIASGLAVVEEAGWDRRELAATHDAMITHPDATTEALLSP